MNIRDPIHGTMPISDEEKEVIDSPFFQRLRHVRQLGFGELAFPGGTHTRHAHSIGAMHVAGRLFDAVAARSGLPPAVRERFRAAVRLAVLCHDIGHMPFSHASESIAPPRAQLGLPGWLGGSAERATHEDFSARLILESPLTPVLRRRYASLGVSPEDVTGLLTGALPAGNNSFRHEGVDWFLLLRSLVSGELDADRMDYLLRDSFYTGVNYGRFDLDWIVQHLCPAERDGEVALALARAAIFAFEDFLISRYHMFVSVYYHHTSVSFDHMLRRYYAEAPAEFRIPADPEAFLGCDDVALVQALRGSHNPWARRIVERRGFKLVTQFTERDEGYDLDVLQGSLAEAGVDHFSVESRGILSKYFAEGAGPPLFILDETNGRLTEVARYTPLYQRYSGALRLSRVYVRPEDLPKAKKALERHGLGPGP